MIWAMHVTLLGQWQRFEWNQIFINMMSSGCSFGLHLSTSMHHHLLLSTCSTRGRRRVFLDHSHQRAPHNDPTKSLSWQGLPWCQFFRFARQRIELEPFLFDLLHTPDVSVTQDNHRHDLTHCNITRKQELFHWPSKNSCRWHLSFGSSSAE